LRDAMTVGNLRGMNQWRAAGLIVLAMFAAWLTLRSCSPEESKQTQQPPAPTRDQFHASKPLLVVVTSTAKDVDLSWLERELRQLLLRGRMRVAAEGSTTTPAYTVNIEIAQALPSAASLKLIAPDGKVEREQQLQLDADELATMRTLASTLRGFLGAAHSNEDWVSYLGTEDAAAYENFVRSSQELLGANGSGFTRPEPAESTPTIERLEALTKRHPRFARAWSLLALAYLNLGGEDESSLTQLAESTAEHALTLDATLTDAQSALGLVQFRRGEWVSAIEHFNTALTTDPNASAALEGLSCLMVDVGHAAQALPTAVRAAKLQPGSIGAAECLSYAQLSTGAEQKETSAGGANALAAAQVRALDEILAGEFAAAQQILQSSNNGGRSGAWIEPLVRAAQDKRQTSQALQAITRAASDNSIDPITEVICGAALRQSDFVFNRMLRLHKQKEAVPLRVLWLPRTEFLRESPRFAEIVSAVGLLPFWQDHGLPDMCKSAPDAYGCKIKPQKLKKEE
jgi:tetratricopeptide (TPR) repeat protein